MLFGAAHRGHKDIAELLIARGVDVKARNENGWTAMNSARHGDQEELVELLKRHGLE